jgi:hypothetical protein
MRASSGPWLARPRLGPATFGLGRA